MRRWMAIGACCVLLGGCGYGNPTASPTGSPDPSPSFNTGTALIDTSNGSVLVHVLVAQTQDQQSY
ncbi:MAG: hypothetical protein ABR579_03720, partial [Actinomycetota bacterium]